MSRSSVTAITELLSHRLKSDASWQGFVGDGRQWVCPCCCGVVEVPSPVDPNLLLMAIEDHLNQDCPDPQASQPDPLWSDTLISADTTFRLAYDPVWRVHDSHNRWLCPGCLTTLPGPGEKHAANHRQSCAALHEGATHDLDVINQAIQDLSGSKKITEEHQTIQWYDDDPIATELPSEQDLELNQAKQLQLGLMREPPEIPNFTISTYYEACTMLSGDFNQFIPQQNGCLAIAQGDVSGHGVRAGMQMAIANRLIDLYAKQYHDPRQPLIQLQRAMEDDLGGRSFITINFGVLNPTTRLFQWVRAGHNPSLLYHATDGSVDEIQPAGIAVGFPMHDVFAKTLTVCETTMEPGDLMLWYTDGINETANPEGVQFNVSGIIDVMKQHATYGPDILIQRIIDAVKAHRQGSPQDDDLSIIAIQAQT